MNINSDIIIFGLVGIVLLYLVIKLLKWPIKLLINGVVGVALLFLTNYIGTYFNFQLDINVVSAIIAGFLGVPGIAFLIIFKAFSLYLL